MGEAKGVRCCEGSHIAYNLLEELFFLAQTSSLL